MKKYITFRQIVTKTVMLEGETKENINHQIDYLVNNPDEINFEKDIDGYTVDVIAPYGCDY